MHTTILSQLPTLTSKTLGALCGSVIPPVRVTGRDRRPVWDNRTAKIDRYVFCHNDLARHNVMVHPKIWEVLAIIDWEDSGFYPPEFEYPFWLKSIAERHHEDEDNDHLIALLDEQGTWSLLIEVVHSNIARRRCE